MNDSELILHSVCEPAMKQGFRIHRHKARTEGHGGINYEVMMTWHGNRHYRLTIGHMFLPSRIDEEGMVIRAYREVRTPRPRGRNTLSERRKDKNWLLEGGTKLDGLHFLQPPQARKWVAKQARRIKSLSEKPNK